MVRSAENAAIRVRAGFRAGRFLKNCLASKDRFGLLLVLVVALIAVWLICLPFVVAIQLATINRFHLTSDSFAFWAVQQPIPPMYNLENRYWLSHQRLTNDKLTVPAGDGIETGMVNHFPARIATFADNRFRLLNDPPETWLYLRSAYQSQKQTTEWRLQKNDAGELTMTRMELGQ